MRQKIRNLLVAVACATCLALVPQLARAQDQDPDPYAQAVQVNLVDGSYTCELTLEGGSGRASVDTPAPVTVKDGRAVVTLTWSSPNYDYMLVAGDTYLPQNTEGNSVFTIPVLALDEGFDIVGDTTAMSVPHEVAYVLTLDAASLKADDEGGMATMLPLAAAVAAAAGVAAVVLIRKRRA